MASVLEVIWGEHEEEYFCARDWTGQITLKSLQKIARPRRSMIAPRADRDEELGMPAENAIRFASSPKGPTQSTGDA